MEKSELILKIKGISSPCCAEEIKEDLLKVEGVKKASVDFNKGIARVEIEPGKMTGEQLIKVVKEAGYEAEVTEREVEEVRFKTELKELFEKYKIPLKELEEHWNFVKEASAKVFAECCKWCHEHGLTEMIDAEAFCKSAIAEGMGESAIADQLFKLKKKSKKMTNEQIKEVVKNRYDEFGEEGGFICPIMNNLAGYTPEQFSLVPEVSRKVSRGCGNPTIFADLKPGEVVCDFGCGGGIDVVLASHKVGPTGTVVGVDFAPHLIELASQAIKEAGLKNAAVFIGDLEHFEKMPDSSADVIISNCVICLDPNKKAIYREAFRILKPGGRLAISDIVDTGDLDPQVEERFELVWQGPFGGALEENEYLNMGKEAGFEEIKVVIRHPLTPPEVTKMASCPTEELISPVTKEDIVQAQGKIVSLKFTAIKPQTS